MPVYRVPETLAYRRLLLPPTPTPDQVVATAADYAAMLVAVMSAIADRYERRPAYPFIDTKLDLITGADFPDDDPLRGRGSVYGWIQGRGLEALADHCRWLRRHPEIAAGAQLVPRLERIMREVSANLRAIRRRNGGHVFFLMTPDGTPFVVRDGRREPITAWDPAFYSFADTFCAKGLYAAAMYLGDAEAAAEALAYCHDVDRAIWENRFVSNEPGVDPHRPPTVPPSPRPQGPQMIHLGTAAVLAEHAQDEQAVAIGLRLIRHILQYYVNVDRRLPELGDCDLWEQNDPAGRPWRPDSKVPSNPGHAIEFVGLGLKFTAAAKRHPACTAAQAAELARVEALMPRILARNFANGFNPALGGICVSVDLLSKAPLSPIMPWWSLPETIRAAMEAWQVAGSADERQECLRILSACHNAFATHYVRPDLHLMAYQSRSVTDGHPVAVIPATADADPGYHTGSSILDFLRVLDAVD